MLHAKRFSFIKIDPPVREQLSRETYAQKEPEGELKKEVGVLLYNNRARELDPKLRQFISPDPKKQRDSYDSYADRGDDPINYNDLNGKCKICVNLLNNGNDAQKKYAKKYSESDFCPFTEVQPQFLDGDIFQDMLASIKKSEDSKWYQGENCGMVKKFNYNGKEYIARGYKPMAITNSGTKDTDADIIEDACMFDLAYLLTYGGKYRALVPHKVDSEVLMGYTNKRGKFFPSDDRMIIYPFMGDEVGSILTNEDKPFFNVGEPSGFIYQAIKNKVVSELEEYGFIQMDPNPGNFTYEKFNNVWTFHNIDPGTFKFWFHTDFANSKNNPVLFKGGGRGSLNREYFWGNNEKLLSEYRSASWSY